MAVQMSVAARNAMLDAFETELITGGAPHLKIFTGAQPSDCAAANSGTELANGNLPADPFAAAASGSKAKSGSWTLTGIAGGTAAHFRLYKNGGTVCVEQGTVGQGSGDLSLDNNVIANGQVVTVTAWTLNAGNA